MVEWSCPVLNGSAGPVTLSNVRQVFLRLGLVWLPMLGFIAALPDGAPLHAVTYYVATGGSDSAAGTSNAPFATPQKAFATMASGDLVYVRGGTYSLGSQLKTSKAGAPGSYCRLWAYPGEKPVLDFSTTPAATKAVVVNKDYWHVKGIEVANATDSGIFIGGSSGANIGFVIIEGCAVHDGYNDGIRIGSTSGSAHDTLILNCDSWRNYDRADGNDGDGFAAKEGCSTNNVFRGCRAWNNSDDGWDFYNNRTNAVLLENCWAFANGVNLWNAAPFSGNGNGFKLGGNSGAIITRANHVLKNCLAFANVHKGFDQNAGEGGIALLNCTGYGNGNENFLFNLTPTGGALAHHVLKNDISYSGGLGDHTVTADSEQVANSWQGYTVTASDFAGLDASSATNSRGANYRLPELPLLHLVPGSDLIDGGVDVGSPFRGLGPDLGAFESGGPAWFSPTPAGLQWTNGGLQLLLNGVMVRGTLVIDASTNLQVWESVYTNSPVTNWVLFVDSSAPDRPARFYRAEEQ